MSRFTLFQRQASPGATVTLRLTRGEDVTGRVTELDDQHVCVDVGERIVTIFEDILAGWDIHQCPPGAPGEATNAKPAASGPTDPLRPPAEELNSATAPVSPSPAADPAVLARRARIDASYSEAAKRARLEPPQPDFTFPDGEFPATSMADVRREWDRARNQYEYALKVREESRLVNVVGQVLRPLVDRYTESPSLRAVMGCLLLKLGHQADAIEHLRTAAFTSRKPDHWYALAYATAGSATECYALRNYLLVKRPDEAWDAWLRYFALAVSHSDATGMVRVLERCFSLEPGSPPREAAGETLVYVYGVIGAPDAAQSATAVLVRGEAFPPEGWRDLLRGILAAPSVELTQEEERATVPSPHPKKTPTVPSGTIASFGTQRFGFIDGDDGETYFFRIDDVVDDSLKQALLEGTWRSHAQVEFTPVPSPGHRYRRAVQVLPHEDVNALLNRAQQLVRINQHSQAMALVRRVLASSPEDPDALKLEADIKQEIRSLGIGLPKGKGPYARAKRAQLQDQDLDAAERLFRQAIQQGDTTESAIKDLASLLQQQGRLNDAASLLESKRKGYSGVSPYDSVLATLYQHGGRHDEAVKLLEGLVRQATRQARPAILRRMAYCHFKAARYDDAERILRDLLVDAPGDRTAERWLAELEEARRIGSYADAAEIIGGFGGLAEEGLELSPLARDAIRTCSFEGVDPSKLQSGALTSKDVDRLEDLAKELGTRRPRDRAAYYLSAAAILSRQPSNEDAARVYDYLRRYFASMGDAAWVAKHAADAVRAYYIESLSLVSDPGDEAWRTLLRYFKTHDPGSQDEFEQLVQHSRKYRDALLGILRGIYSAAREQLIDRLLEVASQSSFAAKAILDGVQADTDIHRFLAKKFGVEERMERTKFSQVWTEQCRERLRSRQQVIEVCRTLTRHQLTAASIEELISQLRSIVRNPLPELDRRRIGDLLDIADPALGFCRSSDFEDKEQHYWLVTTRATSFCEQVREAPTQFAYAGLLPLAEHLRSLTEEQYAETARTSAAQIELRLLVDHYVRSSKGQVKLQVEVMNRQGCSPASNVRLTLGPLDSPYFEASKLDEEIAPTLRGGSSVVSHVTLKLRENASKEPAFPIRARARFRNRVGEDCSSEQVEWTVRLYGEHEFRPLPNRYAPYAEGGPVDDPEMFVGRADLLDRLQDSLLSGKGSKSIVMFGQKRAGKSSLLEHLRRRLLDCSDCVPVQFSLYEHGPRLNEPVFFYQVLKGVADALADRREDGANVPDFASPSLNDLQQHPILRFHEVMSALSREMRRMSENPRLILVLLVDEFTEVFKQIRKGTIAAEFMKAWKAVVEKRYFASVLVGQDIMPAFKAEFPNEFGVTEDVRVTYLAEADARRLIEVPVGAQRYVGSAVSRILGLTAGSPFYTMMFCSRLVDYMNRTRSVVVTDADIAAIAQDMISGDRRLTKDKFDNLICAGDGLQDSGIDPDETFRICAEIARSGDRGWCSRDALRSFEKEKIDVLLADLELRDVVERKGDAYRLRVGLFREWLLVQG